MKKTIYKITVNKWSKYNKDRKPGYRSVLISERFLDDAKVKSLTPVTRLLFLSCILHCSQSDEGQCEVSHESLQSQSGVKSGSLQSQLDLLQSLQLVTYEILHSPLLREDKVKKDKLKEIKTLSFSQAEKAEVSDFALESSPSKKEKKSKPKSDPERNRPTFEAYRDAMSEKYGVEVLKDHEMNIKIKKIVDRVGVDDGPEIMRFYVSHPDSYFVKERHPIGLALLKIESLRTQWLSGKIVTSSDMRQYEKQQTTNSTLKALHEGKI